MNLFLQLDERTREHCMRVGDIVTHFTNILNLDATVAYRIHLASMYHDIGKIKIPLSILNKPDKLTNKEYDVVMKHTMYVSDMVHNLFEPEVCDMILYHHENMDSTGYYGKKGEEIPVGARIIHICDVYDALVSDRPYRKGWSRERTMEYMRENAETMFDKELLKIFFDI